VPEPPSRAVLASLALSLDDLKGRVADAAHAGADAGDDHRAGELWEVERSLVQGARRMGRLLR
jgi:hypothetical protein